MQPCLAQVCSLSSPFENDLEDYAAGACPAIEVWLTKLETYLQTHSLDDVRALCTAHGLTLPIASVQGGLFTRDEPRREEAWEHFRRRLDLCQSLEIGTMVVACDIGVPLEQEDLTRVQSLLEKVATAAGQRQRRVALEFQSHAALGNNLQTAAALVNDVGSPHLGLCLDAFHYYTGPSKPEDLGYLAPHNLFHVQLCDLADVPREFAADADRILPGDGDIPLTPVVEHLKAIDYQGTVSVELMNPQIWQIAPRQFGEVGMTALRKLLGISSMGD